MPISLCLYTLKMTHIHILFMHVLYTRNAYVQRYQVPNPFLSKTINPPNQPNFIQMSIGKRVEVQPQCHVI